jgi:hypothetical protein
MKIRRPWRIFILEFALCAISTSPLRGLLGYSAIHGA